MELKGLKKQVTKTKKRVGQGIAAGGGKTAGRGTKGQKSRTGRKIRPGFEGGQMPLVQRVPKRRGFKSVFAKPVTVRLKRLEVLKDGDVVTSELLFKAGIVEDKKTFVKIVGNEKPAKKLTVKVATSKPAAKAIVEAGGKIEK